MALIDLHDMLSHARSNSYAIGGFELHGLDFLDGVLSAAERAQAPVILDINPALPDMVPLLSAAHAAGRRARIPVALHLETAASPDAAITAIRHGCNGFTLDASQSATAENISRTQAAAAMGRACGVLAAGVLPIPVDPAGTVVDTVDAAQALVSQTGIGLLEFRRDRGSPPALADHDVVTTVLRCGALGLPMAVHEDCVEPAALAELITGGVTKIRCDTALAGAALQRCQDVTRYPRGDYDMLSQRIRQAIADVVARRLTTWGAAGHAAEVLRHCRPQRDVEHLIVYNVDNAVSETQVLDMMATGREVLGAIPGVRRVFTGRAVARDAAYRWCWLVRFSGEAVIDSYREHPEHRHFADGLFRPVAGQRVSIDFEGIE